MAFRDPYRGPGTATDTRTPTPARRPPPGPTSDATPMDCIFCKIVAGDLPSDRVHEDEHCLVFRDIQPQAPVHLLVIPKVHVGSLDELEDPELAGVLLTTAGRMAREAGLGGGWRLIVNTGPDGGQEVGHVHLHVVGGQPLGRMLAG